MKDDAGEGSLDRERYGILQQLDEWLDAHARACRGVDTPVRHGARAGLSPLLEGLGVAIWIIFALEFGLSSSRWRRGRANTQAGVVNVVALVAQACGSCGASVGAPGPGRAAESRSASANVFSSLNRVCRRSFRISAGEASATWWG